MPLFPFSCCGTELVKKEWQYKDREKLHADTGNEPEGDAGTVLDSLSAHGPVRSAEMQTVKKDIQEIRTALRALGNPERARGSMRYFKTGPGGYGQGDVFLGIRTPDLRKFAGGIRDIPEQAVVELLRSPYHEERALALLVLVGQYAGGTQSLRQRIYELYLENTDYINNWDLVDSSAPGIIGAHLMDREKETLYALALSGNIWERRISIIATLYFIRNNLFDETLALAEMLLGDREDLIHKAVGWMLREVGKRSIKAEEAFLTRHYSKMPRTMLRYAIERFSEERRQAYLKGEVQHVSS